MNYIYHGPADADNSPSTLDECHNEHELLKPCQQSDCEADLDSRLPGIQVHPHCRIT